jgi:hypothetical protein
MELNGKQKNTDDSLHRTGWKELTSESKEAYLEFIPGKDDLIALKNFSFAGSSIFFERG